MEFANFFAPALAVLVIVSTALPMVRSGYWWIRVCDYPRLQIAVLGLVAGAALAAADAPAWAVWSLGTLLAAAVAYQLRLIVPFTPLFKSQVAMAPAAARQDRLSILVANVYMPNRRAERLLEIVRDADPDVFLALETDAWWQGRLDVLKPDYPHTLAYPSDNTYGMLLYCKLPMSGAACRFLVDDGVPSVRAHLRMPSGTGVLFHGLHPKPPRIGVDTHSRDAELVMVAREIRNHDAPVVVAGDLNDVAWSHTTRLFLKVSGLLDPRVGRGFYSTFHAAIPVLRWPLDHVFHDRTFRLGRLSRMGYFGSDHFPLYCELVHDKAAAKVHDPPEADRRDFREADRLAAQG